MEDMEGIVGGDTSEAFKKLPDIDARPVDAARVEIGRLDGYLHIPFEDKNLL
jgi:hypothetical protein